MRIRSVDSSQFVTRMRSRDFDMVYWAWGEVELAGQRAARLLGLGGGGRPSRSNYAGIKDPAVDTIINDIIFAKDRDEQVAAVHALDRVMMCEPVRHPKLCEPDRPDRLLGPVRPSRLQEAEVRPRLPDDVVVGRRQGRQDGGRASERGRGLTRRGALVGAGARRSPRPRSSHSPGRPADKACTACRSSAS